jgi:hypothetical protein
MPFSNDHSDGSQAPAPDRAHQGRSDVKKRQNLVDYLRTFPRDIDLEDEVFARNPTPSRHVDFGT